MGFLRRRKMIKLSWAVILLQFVLGVIIAIYPHASKLNPVGQRGNTSSSTVGVASQTTLSYGAFYFISGCIILVGLLNLTEKAIALNKNRESITGEKFLQEYTKILTDAFQIAPEISSMTESQIIDAQKLLLQFISKFVELYFENKSGLQTSANLMVRREIDTYQGNEFFEKVHFVDPGRTPNSYKCVLVLVQASNPLIYVPNDFALPVDNDEHRLFFGAPKAFETGEISLIDNISDVNSSGSTIDRLLAGQPHVVAEKIRDFFGKMEYKSFASIPLRTSKGKIVGVINIQSNQPYILGTNNNQIETIKKYLNPFFVILTALVK